MVETQLRDVTIHWGGGRTEPPHKNGSSNWKMTIWLSSIFRLSSQPKALWSQDRIATQPLSLARLCHTRTIQSATLEGHRPLSKEHRLLGMFFWLTARLGPNACGSAAGWESLLNIADLNFAAAH